MGMSIDLAMNNLSGILTEATEDEDSVCYVTEDDAETLRVAISTMRKYQKIAEIVKEWGDSGLLQNQLYDKLHEVVEDREHEIYRDSWTADILDSWYGPTIEAIPKADYETRLKADLVAMLTMLRQDLLDKLAEEKSAYHISDVGVGLERAIATVDEYIGR